MGFAEASVIILCGKECACIHTLQDDEAANYVPFLKFSHSEQLLVPDNCC